MEVLAERKTGMRSWAGLAGWVLLALAVGAVAGWLTSASVKTWYPSLVKPTWTPPPWLFAPVWTVLYVAMGVAAWLVWIRGGFRAAKVALSLYLVQLALNAAWSGIFFGLRAPGLAFAEIAVLWLAIALTVSAFSRVSRPAAWLLLPYHAWVSFAAALDFRIWQLNG